MQIYNYMDRITVQDIEQINLPEDMNSIALPYALPDDDLQPVDLNNDLPTIVSTSDAEPNSNPGEADVAAILQHTGKAKKKTKMKFQVHWQGYDTTHDSWLPWSELRHNIVLHAYLQAQHLGHLIPREYQPTSSLITNNNQPDDSSKGLSSSTESRGDDGDISSNHHATPIHAALRDQVNMQKQFKAWLSREERMQAREAKEAIVIAEGTHSVSELLSQLNEQSLVQVHCNNSDNTNSEQCYFADWSNHTEESIYYSFTEDAYIMIDSDSSIPEAYTEEEAFKAVVGPRKFDKALGDKDWGDPVRTELETVTTATRTIVEVDRSIALEHIRNGAQLLRLIPIYEEMMREGVLVRKVRWKEAYSTRSNIHSNTKSRGELPPVGDARSPFQVPPPPPAWPVPLLPLQGLTLDGGIRGDQEEYAEKVYIYHLVNAATALANASRHNVGGYNTSVQDISVGFGMDRSRLNVVCTEAPGVVVVYTEPAMDDEGDMDSVLDGNYGAASLDHNQREHYNDLKDRYRQRRDHTRQLIAQLSTLNTRQNLNPTEVRLLGRTLSKEDIRKFSKFETLATTICDQQDAIEGLRRRYDEQVASSSSQLAQLTRSHEARIAQELGQAKLHVDVANDRVKAIEAQAQLLLKEQEQRSELLISELCKALKAITDQDVANTRASAELEVQLRKELQDSKHRIDQLEPA